MGTFGLKLFFLTIIIIFPFLSYSQDLTGTWEGVFTAERWGRRTNYSMRLELVQIDRDVHGNLSIKNEKTDSLAQVNYILSGELSKKKSSSFKLFREDIYDTDLARETAEFFNDLLVEWKTADTAVSHIEGFWFPNMGPGTLPNGAAGKYAVTKTSTTVATPKMQAWLKAKIIEAKL
jgi:hypothetical protein